MKTLILVCCMAICASAQAQGWDEWFNQKATQKKYLIKQIALLKTLRGLSNKGYNIVKDGLHSLGGAKSDELAGHANYYRSLYIVSPAIRSHRKVQQVREMYGRILVHHEQAYFQVSPSNVLSQDEARYIRRVYDRLLNDSKLGLSDLNRVVTDGELQMTDAERMQKIDEYHCAMLARLRFSIRFMNEAKLMVEARLNQQKEIEQSMQRHGVKF